MSHHDDLGVVLGSDVAQQDIDLLLTQNLQMRIGFVDQQHAPFVGKQVREDQQHLLKAAP